MTSPTDYLGKIYEDWDRGREDVNVFFHCRSGKIRSTVWGVPNCRSHVSFRSHLPIMF